MKELDRMIQLGLASIDTSERVYPELVEGVILVLTLLTNLAHERDKLYRFFMACAGPAYIPDAFYWQDYFKANP